MLNAIIKKHTHARTNASAHPHFTSQAIPIVSVRQKLLGSASLLFSVQRQAQTSTHAKLLSRLPEPQWKKKPVPGLRLRVIL